MLIKIMFSDWKADHKYQPKEKKNKTKGQNKPQH